MRRKIHFFIGAKIGILADIKVYMKKLYFGLFIVIFILSASPARAQVFGYPGATWVFQHPPFVGVCFQVDEKWEYVQDTTLLGISSKDVLVTTKITFPPPFINPVVTNLSHRYFHVSGDTVSIFALLDSSWVDLFDFSLQLGDTTHSPLKHRKAFGSTCDTSILYDFPAIVTEAGLDTIDGQSLRYYKVKYRIGMYPNDDFTDTIYEYQTYRERMIGNYWYPYDSYNCGLIEECGPFGFSCYKDNGMVTDNLCADFTWFETLDIAENTSAMKIIIYPNPVNEYFSIQNSQIENYQILSCDGKFIANCNGNYINVSQLPAGLYFICNENRTWFKKFIKD